MGKGKPHEKGKGKGKGPGKGKAKGGRGNGNFPAAYTPNTSAYYTEEQQWQNSDSNISEVNETPDWQDYNFFVIEKEENNQLSEFCEKIDDTSDKIEALKKKRMLTENFLTRLNLNIL